MKTMFVLIMISLLTVSCALLEEMPEDDCGGHCCDGMKKLSLIERQRLAERTGIPWHVWDDQKISAAVALALKERYQLHTAYFTDEEP